MSYIKIPTKNGFYLADGTPCEFADSKQIGKDKYRLQHDLYYRAVDGRIFLVKKGFIHDGASKGFLKRFGRYTNAAILHDALYGSKLLSRKEADKLFLEAMKSSNVVYLRRYTYYYAVRAFGSSAWKSKSKRVIKKNKRYILIFKKESR